MVAIGRACAWAAWFLGAAACGGSQARVDATATASGTAGASGASSAATSASGAAPATAPASTTASAPAAAPAPAPAARPFASSALEAQSMIQSAIDDQVKVLWKCVEDHRKAKHEAHGAITVDIGIDQEGTLLGIIPPNPKKPLDPALKDCMMAALHGLTFPRSHAGIITVRQTFQDQSIQP